MSNRPDKLLRFPAPVLRLCIAICGLGMFFGASMMIGPRAGRANEPFPGANIKGRTPHGEALLNPNQYTGAPNITPTIKPMQGAAPQPFDATHAPLADDRGNVLLGFVMGRNELVVWVYSGPFGPLYTVAHKTQGVLASSLEHDDLYRRFPELNIDQLRMHPADLNAGTPIMFADPDKQ